MAIKVPSAGPSHGVRVMIVGEAPGASEEASIAPFVGASGQELTKILHEAGIVRAECFITNVCKYRPPLNVIDNFCATSKRKLRGREPYTTWGDRHITAEFYEGILELKSDIETIKPNVIIALGDTALWTLTGKSGITLWRGSIMQESLSPISAKVVPTYHPAAILRMWEWRAIMLHDIRRARSESETAAFNPPAWDFELRPSFEKVMHRLAWLKRQASLAPFKLGVDIETRGGQIACVGLAWTSRSAICIPLLCTENIDGYWPREEELAITLALRDVLTDPNILCVGQNFLYDAQYFASRMFFIPNLTDDTMFQQHVAFVGLPKALYFIASMYCSQYVYWKEDGKEWDASMPEDNLWGYNCTDACRTLEAHVELDRVIWRLGLHGVYKFQMRLWRLALRAMLRGVRINQTYRNEILNELLAASDSREEFIKKVVGYALNPRSPKQMHHFLYTELGLPSVHNRKTGKITANFEALQKCATREPLIAPIATALLEQRSIGTYISTFVRSPLDSDGRVRCSFNPAGTESYRLSSSQSAFGTGMNLQNIPYETRKKATADKIGLRMEMPNIRKMFVPDPGYVICDMDLDRADLQVVVWEANDQELMAALRLGADIHLLNGAALYGVELAVEECIETSPGYKDLRKRFTAARQFAKNWVHGCVDSEHEALTPNGWVRVDRIEDTTPIMTCNHDGTNPRFEQCYWLRDLTDTEMVHFTGPAYDQCVTWDHKMPYVVDATGVKVTTAAHVPVSGRLLKAAEYTTPSNTTLGRLLSAFHADGSIHRNQVRFHFKKQRKIDRLLTLAPTAQIHGPYDDGSSNVTISGAIAEILIRFGKAPTWDLLAYPEIVCGYIEELEHWDGTIGDTSKTFFTSNKTTAEIVQAMLHLTGHSGSILENGGKYRVQINNRPLARVEHETFRRKGVVYCPRTTSGFWLTRRNGRIGITGNTNYGGSAETMAFAAGVSKADSQRYQTLWFDRHPGILEWHERTKHQLMTRRMVENKFGYRRFYFDRIEQVLPEALAWIPQSTVSCVINRAWDNIETHFNNDAVQVLLQVHDSLVFQVHQDVQTSALATIANISRITVPYQIPLVIPTGLKTSRNSWGDCESTPWPKQ